MNINGIRSDLVRAPGVGQSDAARDAEDAPRAPERARQVDRVEISNQARQLSEQQEPAKGGDLSPQRLAEIRHRIQSGAYLSPAIVDEIARRILASGDV